MERLRLENEALRAQVAALLKRIAKLEAELAAARKNSRNSSRPPSSDLAKPVSPAGNKHKLQQKLKRGGQPRHERKSCPPEEIDETFNYARRVCPVCGGGLTPGEVPPRVLQQVEVATKPIRVTEHRRPACVCVRCGTTHYALLSEEVRRAGLIGPRLTAVVAFLKGGCHCSFTTIRKFLRDVPGGDHQPWTTAEIVR